MLDRFLTVIVLIVVISTCITSSAKARQEGDKRVYVTIPDMMIR